MSASAVAIAACVSSPPTPSEPNSVPTARQILPEGATAPLLNDLGDPHPPITKDSEFARRHLLWASASLEGRSQLAIETAQELTHSVPVEKLNEMPYLEEFLPTHLLALERFSKWDELFLIPPPPSGQLFTMGMWHYARGRALVQIMRIEDAQNEHGRIKEIAESDTMKSLSMNSPGTTGQDLLRIAERVLAGDLARAKDEWAEAISALESGVQLQDSLAYSEPPPWYFPVRDLLGTALLEAGEPAKAEAVFREQLELTPRNGWTLRGLADSLLAQDKKEEARETRRQFKEAWKYSDLNTS
jgi:tetratricopeptide (TPR) repeat protein